MKTTPLILDSLHDTGRRLVRSDVTSNDSRNEAWLQELLYSHPELLPVDEFDDSFAPPIPIGREVSTGRGPIDGLFVSPTGGITVVETKLWKNPEKHRTVVAQVIDYAKELATWDYDQLCNAILASSRRRGEMENVSLEQKVAAGLALNGVPLDEFQEGVAETLSNGRFLLLIVGDRISPNIALLTKAIQSAPGLGFTLGLAEMQLYETTLGQQWPLLIVPEILGRTVEQARGIVRVQYIQEKPKVAVVGELEDEGENEVKGSLNEKLDQEHFFKLIPLDLLETVREGISEWQAIGGHLQLTPTTACFDVSLFGHIQRFVRWRIDEISVVTRTDFSKLPEGNRWKERYLELVDSSPIVASHVRNNRMWIKFKALSPADLQILLRAARTLVQQIRDVE